MTSTDNTPETSRPFGYWLKATDRLMAAEFAAAFESFGVTRRDWRLLNRIDGTVADARPLPTHKISRLIELGWVTRTDDTWTLSDEGRDAKERLGSIVDGIRAKVADAVPADDLETTIRTLEHLARAFGWDENTPLPRGGGRGGHRHGRGHGHGGYGHHRHDGHGQHRHGGRKHHDGLSPRGHGDEAPHLRSWRHGAHDFDSREFGHRVHDARHGRFDVPPFGGSGERGHGPDRRDGGGICREHERSFGGDPHARHERWHHHHGDAGTHQRGRHGDGRARMAQSAYERGFDAGFSHARGDR